MTEPITLSADEGYAKYRGKCQEYCEAAILDDPSLALVRGYYYEPIWGTREEHWWTKRPDGTIFDPTREQFPSKGMGAYEEFDGWLSCEECGKEIREEEAYMCGRYPCCSNACAMRLVGL